MATNVDSFPITAAMLAYAWVKPTVSFNTAAGETNATDDYTPRSQAERAGAQGGTSAAVPGDTNWTFASTIDPGQEKVGYPNTISTVAAVECDATLSVTNVES